MLKVGNMTTWFVKIERKNEAADEVQKLEWDELRERRAGAGYKIIGALEGSSTVAARKAKKVMTYRAQRDGKHIIAFFLQ